MRVLASKHFIDKQLEPLATRVSILRSDYTSIDTPTVLHAQNNRNLEVKETPILVIFLEWQARIITWTETPK